MHIGAQRRVCPDPTRVRSVSIDRHSPANRLTEALLGPELGTRQNGSSSTKLRLFKDKSASHEPDKIVKRKDRVYQIKSNKQLGI